jgi:hypothetical protein
MAAPVGEFAGTLREINLSLETRLAAVRAASAQQRAVSPEEMSSLLSELLRAGSSLRSERLPAPGADAVWEKEIDRYRRQVEELRELLPLIHRQLLAERSRIEGQRVRLESVSEWAQASRQTF